MAEGISVGRLFATLGLDKSPFDKAIKGAGGDATTLQGKLGAIGKGVALGAGIGAFNLLSGAVTGVIDKLDEAHQAFLDDQAGQEQLAGALQRNIPNWDGNRQGAEAYATAQAALGFADDEVRASLGQLVGITHDLTEAQNLNTLAQDLARAKNIDLAQATDIVTKAAQGNGKALKGLGVDIEGAKTAADFLAATERNVNGAAEEWAATNEGKLAVSNVKVGEAMEKIGGIVDKVSQVVLPALADAFVAIVGVLDEVSAAVQPVIDELGPRLRPIIEALTKTVLPALATGFRTVFGAIGSIVGGAVALWSGEIDVFMKLLGTIGDVVRGSVSAAVGIANGIIDGINAIQLHIDIRPPIGPEIKFDWNGVGLPHIKLASGTPAFGGGLALLGERGPELAALPRGTRVYSADQTRAVLGGAQGNGGVTISTGDVVFQVQSMAASESEARTFARKMWGYLEDEARRRGQSLQPAHGSA